MNGRPVSRREGVLGVAAMALGGPPPTQPEMIQTTFPTRSGRNPVVVLTGQADAGSMAGTTLLLLHGSGGLAGALRVFVENGRRLAAAGYRVVMPVYFSSAPDAAATDNTDWWAEAVEDAAAWSLTLPGADPARLVAMGYSRGGYLAAEVAVRTTAIAAVVGVASAGNVAAADIVRRPPVLLVHATNDPVVPPARTRRWANILRQSGVPVEIETMHLSRHIFEDEEWARIFHKADVFFRRALASTVS